MASSAGSPVPLLINRGAGLGRARRAESCILRRLAAMGVEVEAVPTASAAQAAEVCADLSDACERILVAGGDGTVNSVLPSLAGSRTALGILPVGMANALAREMGIPLSLAGMCRVAAGNHLRSMDLGCANGRPFVLMAGLGFDARVVGAVKPGLKRVLGPVAYVITALALARASTASRLEVTHDAGRVDLPVWLAVVANASTYTYHWKAVPDASTTDGLLDLCMFRCCSAGQMLGQIAAALCGRHLSHPEVLSIRASAFTLTATPPLPVQVDGDAAGTTPLTVTVMPSALRVIVP